MLKNITYLFVLTTIAVVAFIIFTIIHNSISPTIDQDIALKTTSLTPSFDSSALAELKQRTVINPNLSAKLVVNSVTQTSSTSSALTNQNSNILEEKNLSSQ